MQIDSWKNCSQADLGRVPERFLLSVRTKSKTENFVFENYAHCLFLQFFSAFFNLEPRR